MSDESNKQSKKPYILAGVGVASAAAIAVLFTCYMGVCGSNSTPLAKIILDAPTYVPAGSYFMVAGTLYDTSTGEGLAGKTISLDSSLGVNELQSTVTTDSIKVETASNDGVEVKSCSTVGSPPDCSPDFDSVTDADNSNRLLILKTGDKITFPAGTKGVTLFLQGMQSTTFTYDVIMGAEELTDRHAMGQGPNIEAIHIIGAAKPDATGTKIQEDIKQIIIKLIDGPSVSISAIEITDPSTSPTFVQRIDFENLQTGMKPSPFEINKGSFFIKAKAPDTANQQYRITASIADASYHASNHTNEFTIHNTLREALGAYGEPVNIYSLDANTYNVVICGINNDRDKDSICDDWETYDGATTTEKATDTRHGVPYTDQGGVPRHYNLCYTPASGGVPVCPSPDVPDVFVEIDYMPGHKPDPQALSLVTSAFKKSGTSGNGIRDINLNLLVDESIPHMDAINAWTDPTPNNLQDDFGSIKNARFGFSTANSNDKNIFGGPVEKNSDGTPVTSVLGAKAQVYHYALFVHAIGQPPGDPVNCNSPSGLAEVNGNDIIVALGCKFGETDSTHAGTEGTYQEQAGTLMHELGHNLGLDHGGPRQILNNGVWQQVEDWKFGANCKPNYASVMSYTRQIPTFLKTQLANYWTPSYSDQAMPVTTPSLSESTMDEYNGVKTSSALSPASYKIVFGTPTLGTGKYKLGDTYKEGTTRRGIDWSGDNTISPSGIMQSLDVNNLSITGCDSSAGIQTLQGLDDWNNLNFDFRSSLAYIDGVRSAPIPELTTEVYQEMVNRSNYYTIINPAEINGSISYGAGVDNPEIRFNLTTSNGTLISNEIAGFMATKVTVNNTTHEITSESPALQLPGIFKYDNANGWYKYTWNTSNLQSGTYAIKIYINNNVKPILLDKDGYGYTALVQVQGKLGGGT